jgi:hypothetical protein
MMREREIVSDPAVVAVSLEEEIGNSFGQVADLGWLPIWGWFGHPPFGQTFSNFFFLKKKRCFLVLSFFFFYINLYIFYYG